MPLLNYTTTVSVDRSIQAIQKALVKVGASSLMQDFDADGNISAVAFRIRLEGQEIQFKLPAQWRSVQQVLVNQRVEQRYRSDDHARRVAWRIIKDWVEAQMAIVETKMVTLPQVFLPYAVNKDGKTLYEIVAENPQLLLGEGNGE